MSNQKLLRAERGSMLIATMGIVIVLTGLALVFAREMRVEALASGNLLSSVQADAIVQGAALHVFERLKKNTDRTALDTEIHSEEVPIGEGFFWIVRPDPEDEHRYQYGVTDEAAKLNVNTATLDMLLRLPGMTAEFAASIIDWRDDDDVVTEGGGGENEYYLLMADPYYCKNAPFETLDELLMVKGATRELLFGVDSNRNGVVDVSESNGTAQLSSLNGQAQCGVIKYLTVYSVESNVSATGEQKLFVGDNRPQTLSALAVLLLRTLKNERVTEITTKLRGTQPATSDLDFFQKSGMTQEEFTPIADKITTDRQRTRQGLINVNTAPREVLLCLPGLEEADADLIIAKRASNGPDLQNIAWVSTALSVEKAAKIGNNITAHSSQFSADIIAVTGNGRGFKRFKYVFDVGSTQPRTLYCKDLTHLGWSLSDDVLAAVKSGSMTPTLNAGSFSLERR